MFYVLSKIYCFFRLEKAPRDQGDCLDLRGTICHGGISSLEAPEELFGGGPYRNFISQQVTVNSSDHGLENFSPRSGFFLSRQPIP